MRDLRFGILNYLNCLPATLALEQGRVETLGWTLKKGMPAELNSAMRCAELDVSLVSAAEYLQNEELYRPLQDFCLWCDGAVQSVCLYSKHDRERLKEQGGLIAVTPESASSVALAELLVPKARTLAFSSLQDAHSGLQDNRFQAVLLIGDKALEPPAWTQSLRVHDLGQWWKDETGFPMTFALWVARRELNDEQVQSAIDIMFKSLDWGRANREQVLEEAVRRSGLSRQALVSYYQGLLYLGTESSRIGFQEYRSRLKESRVALSSPRK